MKKTNFLGVEKNPKFDSAMEHYFLVPIFSLVLLAQFAIPHPTAPKIGKEYEPDILKANSNNDTLVFAHVVSKLDEILCNVHMNHFFRRENVTIDLAKITDKNTCILIIFG